MSLDPETHYKEDPVSPQGGTQPFKMGVSTATFVWVPTNGFDTAPPAGYEVSRSYKVKVNASASRNNPGAGASAFVDSYPRIPLRRYDSYAGSSSTWNDTGPVEWEVERTDVSYGYSPGEVGEFEHIGVVGIRTSIALAAFPGTGGYATASSSASAETTEIKLVTGP